MASSNRIFRYAPPPGGWHTPLRRRRRSAFPASIKTGAWISLAALLSLAVFGRACRKDPAMDTPSGTAPEDIASQEPDRTGLLQFGYPTKQTRLLDTEDTTVFMPTGSGRVASALFGSTRTVQRGNRVVPSFHEGIDIAPLKRDRRGRPLDDILAVADGRVAYINTRAGNSTYGIYIVLEHEDPVGPVYTLYAHLASAADGLKTGDPVTRGHVIGRMGNTSTLGIPMQRAHVHFEIGTMMNQRFDQWFKAKGLTPTTHGRYNGLNLRGMDPLEVYRGWAEDHTFSLLDWFRSAEPAFSVVVNLKKPLDYAERHPRLWTGPRLERGAVVLNAQEGGLILSVRPATPEEAELLGRTDAEVLSVNESALGRNGRRIVVRRGDTWTLGAYGQQWIEKLTW